MSESRIPDEPEGHIPDEPEGHIPDEPVAESEHSGVHQSDGPTDGGGGSKLSRDALVVGIAAVLLIAAGGGILIGHLVLKSGSQSSTNTTSSTTTSTTRTTAKLCGPWPADVQSKSTPSEVQLKNPKPGIYIWKTFYTWHVQAIAMPGNVSGSVIGTSVLKITAAPGSTTIATAKGKTIQFSVPAARPPVDLEFSSGPCVSTQTLFLTFQTSTGLVPPNQIWLGKSSVSATANPLSISRVPPGF